jgi:hypothetical protein
VDVAGVEPDEHVERPGRVQRDGIGRDHGRWTPRVQWHQLDNAVTRDAGGVRLVDRQPGQIEG